MWKIRLFGIPISVQPWFWVIAAVIGLVWARNDLGLAVLIIAVTLISFVIHELGHALMARHFGARPVIVLHGMGGTTSYMGAGNSRNRKIAITAAGPIAGFALAAVFFILFSTLTAMEGGSLLRAALFAGVVLNIFWNVLNLMPVMPMDGGQILRDLLGPKHRRTVSIIGAVTGAILCVVALMIRQPFVAIAFGALAWQNYQAVPMQGGVVRS